MSAIDVAGITRATQNLLDEQLNVPHVAKRYIIERNESRNTDENRLTGVGLIGIWRGGQRLNPRTTGRNWLAEIDITVEVQVCSWLSGEDAEDKLQLAEQEVIDIFMGKRTGMTASDGYTLKGTVNMVKGFDIVYQFNNDSSADIYFHSAIITMTTEVYA